jgi:O-antigen/teichoic acid export membrane protein
MIAAVRNLLGENSRTLASGFARVRRREGLIGAALFDSVGGFAIRVGLTGVNFVLMIVLLRLLGRSEFGAYSFTIAMLSLMIFPAMLGYDGYLIQKVSRLLADGRNADAGAYVRGVLTISFLAASLLAFVGGALAASSPIFGEQASGWAVPLALACLPLAAAQKLTCSALLAFGRRLTAAFLDELLTSCVMLLVIGAVFIGHSTEIDYRGALLLRIAATGVGLAVGLCVLSRHMTLFTPVGARADGVVASVAEWRREVLPFMLNSSISIGYSSIGGVLLGVLAGADAVGQFQPAQRLVSLLSFAMSATNLVIQPTIARFHAQRRTSELQRLVTTTARASFLFSSLIAGVFFFAAEPILRAMSEELGASATALRIMLAGTWFATAMPAGATVLLMCGYQKVAARMVLGAFLGSTALNLLLIPTLGVEGVALATTAASLWVYAALWSHSRTSTGLDVSIFGRFARREEIAGVPRRRSNEPREVDDRVSGRVPNIAEGGNI